MASAGHFPAEAVSTTKHNLSANPNIQFGTAVAGSSEVCVYCHTPHGAGYSNQLNVGMPPLWNRKINVTDNYTTYDSLNSPHFETSSDATLNGQVKGVSLACLSCHDGTIAFDALINLQGSGGYQGGNATAGTGPGDGFGVVFGGQLVDVDSTFTATPRTNGSFGDPFGGSLFGNDTNSGTGSMPFPNLTEDLSDDHPISFEIPTTDPQFTQVIFGSEVATSNLLYLKRAETAGINGALPADPRDRIRAYPSTGLGLTSGSATGAYIECASCHNPHTPRTVFLRLPSNVSSTGVFVEPTVASAGLPTGGGTQSALSAGVTGGIFWSHAPNQASAICLSCHQK